jgi:hypothetical protein
MGEFSNIVRDGLADAMRDEFGVAVDYYAVGAAESVSLELESFHLGKPGAEHVVDKEADAQVEHAMATVDCSDLAAPERGGRLVYESVGWIVDSVERLRGARWRLMLRRAEVNRRGSDRGRLHRGS